MSLIDPEREGGEGRRKTEHGDLQSDLVAVLIQPVIRGGDDSMEGKWRKGRERNGYEKWN